MLGDHESKGFLYYCFQVKNGCHYFCCHFLDTLLKTLNRSFNPNCDKFRQVVFCLPLAKLKQLGIGSHVETSGFKRCRLLAFELVDLLEKFNPRTNYGSLFISVKMKAVYSTWKERRTLAESVDINFRETPVNPPSVVESAMRVLSQELEESDFQKKISNFKREAATSFAEEHASLDDVTVRISIENSDMAALRCCFALDATSALVETVEVASEPASPHSKGKRDAKATASQKKTVVKEEGQDDSFKDKLEQYVRNSVIPGEDKAIMELKKNKNIEMKIQFNNTIFVLSLKNKIRDRDLRDKNVIGQLNFESVEALPTTSKVDAMETSIDVCEKSARKLSFGFGNPELVQPEKGSGSTVSTICGSEFALNSSPASQVICNLEGSLTLTEEVSAWTGYQRSKQFSANMFILAKDQNSKSFIRAVPTLKNALKNLFLQTYAILQEE